MLVLVLCALTFDLHFRNRMWSFERNDNNISSSSIIIINDEGTNIETEPQWKMDRDEHEEECTMTGDDDIAKMPKRVRTRNRVIEREREAHVQN